MRSSNLHSESLNYLFQKRKGEDVEPPVKRRRIADSDSKAESSKKRKELDEELSPRKRARFEKGNSNPHSSEKVQADVDVEPQGRARDHTRVKEFPAGNVTTSSSRISFLQSLCRIPKFRSLVDLVPFVVSY